MRLPFKERKKQCEACHLVQDRQDGPICGVQRELNGAPNPCSAKTCPSHLYAKAHNLDYDALLEQFDLVKEYEEEMG